MKKISALLIFVGMIGLACTDSNILNFLRQAKFLTIEQVSVVPRNNALLISWNNLDWPSTYLMNIELVTPAAGTVIYSVRANLGSFLLPVTAYTTYPFLRLNVDAPDGKQSTIVEFSNQVTGLTGDLIVTNAGVTGVNGLYRRIDTVSATYYSEDDFYVHYQQLQNPYYTLSIYDYIGAGNGDVWWTFQYLETFPVHHYANENNLAPYTATGNCPLTGWSTYSSGTGTLPLIAVIE